MNNYEEKFEEVVSDVISKIFDIKYEDTDKNIILTSIGMNLSHMTRDYETYNKSIDTLRNCELEEKKSKVLSKKF